MAFRIEGVCINIRSFRLTDAYSIANNANDVEISQYTYLPFPYKVKDAEDFINQCNINFVNKTDFEFGIENKANNMVIGIVSLMHVDFLNKNAEIGFWLGKKYWRRGIAKEALKLLLNFAFHDLKLTRICAKVMHPNYRSIKLLESIGFKSDNILKMSALRNGNWLDQLIYSLRDEEFKS